MVGGPRLASPESGPLVSGRHAAPGGTDTLRVTRERTIVREFAAVALAFIGDRREKDVLFGFDAYFNPSGTTSATHELMRLY
ncbi:MAG: hypothetical protein ACYTEZ_08705 [Planctomycetota bacterium]